MRAFLLAAVLAAACEVAPEPRADAPASVEPTSGPSTPVGASEPQAVASFLSGYDFEERVWYRDLPGRLDEVSGLAFTPDGRLFAHDDERGRVHEIDPASGEVGKRFDLGEDLVRADFEGVAVIGERFFLVTSTAWLYEFREGADRENVAYRLTDSGLGDRCEVEGLDHDPGFDALLVACKTTLPDRGLVVVHRLPIQPDVSGLPDLTVRRSELEAVGVDPTFAPSGVAVTPVGTVLLLSGRDDAIVEVDQGGRVVAAVELRGGRHPQSEGIAIAPDGGMYISDERNGKEPRLTRYGRSPDAAGSGNDR